MKKRVAKSRGAKGYVFGVFLVVYGPCGKCNGR